MKTYLDILVESIAPQIVDKHRARYFMSRRAPGAEPHPPVESNKPGTLLTMSDESRWFHADDGSQPIQILPANAEKLTIEEGITGYEQEKGWGQKPVGSLPDTSQEDIEAERTAAKDNVAAKRAARAAEQKKS